MLRLEHLFVRLDTLLARDDAIDHHFALVSIFEIMDVASRADLKSDLLKELERQKQQVSAYRGNPAISEAALDEVLGSIEGAHGPLNRLVGKAGIALMTNEWLMGIRSRVSIPGGTCEFDLPAYYAWQQTPATARRADLLQWAATLTPFADALRVLMRLLRDSGSPHRFVAVGGQYQQSLPQSRTYQLLRLRCNAADGLVPEISGHRLLVSVRFMRQEPEGRMRPSTADTAFELTLCA